MHHLLSSRLVAEGGRAVSAGSYSKSGVQQVNATQRKALGASTAVSILHLPVSLWRSLRRGLGG